MGETARTSRVKTMPIPAATSWAAALLLPSLCVAAAVLGSVRDRGTPTMPTTPHRAPPITGTLATVADCGRELVELRTVRLRWRPAGLDAPGPLDLVVEGDARSRGLVDRFIARLDAHGFLGEVAATRLLDRGDAVEFELRLGDAFRRNAAIADAPVVVAMAEARW